MSKDENIAALVRFGNAVNSGNLADIRNVVSADSLDNDPSPDQGRGPEGYIRMFTEIRQAFPDLNVDVVKLLADDDSVAFAYTMTGTHKGNFMGIPGTGRKIKARLTNFALRKRQNGRALGKFRPIGNSAADWRQGAGRQLTSRSNPAARRPQPAAFFRKTMYQVSAMGRRMFTCASMRS